MSYLAKINTDFIQKKDRKKTIKRNKNTNFVKRGKNQKIVYIAQNC